MVVIQIKGTSPVSTEEELQALTRELLALCKEGRIDDPYVEFPVDRTKVEFPADRMKMDLGDELVVQIYGLSSNYPEEVSHSRSIREIVKRHFSKAKIGLQMVEAETICGFKEE